MKLQAKIYNRVFPILIIFNIFIFNSQISYADTNFPCGTSGSYTVTGTIITADNSCVGTLIIQSGATEIASNVFMSNVNITSVTIPDSVLVIGNNAFKNTKIVSLDLGEGVTSIGQWSFGDASTPGGLDVLIPDSVTTLSANAFAQTRLGHVVIGEGLTTLESNVFYNNRSGSGLKSIIFGSNISTIKVGALFGISATYVVLPDSLRIIQADAFKSSEIGYIYIPTNLTTLSITAFSGGSTLSKAVYCGTDTAIRNFDYPGTTTSTCEKLVTFNSNFSAPKENYQSSNSAGVLDTNTFTRDGFTFSHWNTQKNGSGIRYENGQSFNFASNLKLYAQWTSNSSATAPWIGAQSITCPTPNPWVKEKLGFAKYVKPVLVSAENTIGKTITQGSYDSLKSSGVVFDTVSKKVSTATETLPIYGCKDKLLSGKLNQPIQFIAGGYTLQSDAHGYINTADLKWHDTNGVTLYTNTAAFMHTIKFTKTGKYVVVLTEQPDTGRGLIPTHGVRSIRFVININ